MGQGWLRWAKNTAGKLAMVIDQTPSFLAMPGHTLPPLDIHLIDCVSSQWLVRKMYTMFIEQKWGRILHSSFFMHLEFWLKSVERKYYLNGKSSSRKYPRWGDIIILVSQVTSSVCGRWPRKMSSWSPALPTCWRASPSSTASSSPASPSSSPCPSCRRTSCSGSPPTPPPTPWSSCTSPWLAVCTRWGTLELF